MASHPEFQRGELVRMVDQQINGGPYTVADKIPDFLGWAYSLKTSDGDFFRCDCCGQTGFIYESELERVAS